MNPIIEITITPEEIQDLNLVHAKACAQARLNPQDWKSTIVKSSIDARKRPIFRLQVALHVEGENPLGFTKPMFPWVGDASKKALIIGAGPAGLFAALKLIQ
ncbi:MAG: FAD-binding protein, partial [Bacteroidetes bacterium]|nr:FAD-binding protein [Bacteroidota bacterium]